MKIGSRMSCTLCLSNGYFTANFAELLPRAESFEIFLKSTEISSTSNAAFVAHSHHKSNFSFSHQKSAGNRQPQGHNTRGGSQGNCGGAQSGGRGQRRPLDVKCVVLKDDRCTQRYDRPTSRDFTNLVEAFNAVCSLATSHSDWYIDTGASAHMMPNTSVLDSATPYIGSDGVIIRNSDSLPISHSGSY